MNTLMHWLSDAAWSVVDAAHSLAQWVRDKFRRAMNRIGGGQGEE